MSAGGLKSDLAQYQELAAFALFASDLDAATRRQLDRGERLMEILKQPQNSPYSLVHQIYVIYSGTRGYLDDVATGDVRRFLNGLIRYMDTVHPAIGEDIESRKRIVDETEEKMKQAIVDFKASFS